MTLPAESASETELSPSTHAATVHGYLVVPFRVVFDASGVWHWLRDGWPLLWQTWSDITDFSRIPFTTRLEILRYRYNHLFKNMWMPGHWRAVRWWLGRLMARNQWSWDRELVAAHTTDSARGQTLDTLRRPLREFLYPEGLVDLLTDYRSLLDVEDGYVYVPPTTAYHIRLRTLRAGHEGWIALGSERERDYLTPALEPRGERLTSRGASQPSEPPTEAVPIRWQHVRLHLFRFGDGFLSLSFELERRAQPEKNLAAALERLRHVSRHPEHVQLGFTPGRRRQSNGMPAAPLPWEPPTALGLGTVARHLLTPSQLDAEEPELDQWAFLWDDPPSSLRNRHRIEFPLAKQMPMLLLPSSADSAESQPEPVSECIEDVYVRTGLLAERGRAAPEPPSPPKQEAPTETEASAEQSAPESEASNASAPVADGSDEIATDEQHVVESAPAAATSERDVLGSPVAVTSRLHALSVFLFALLRRVKLAQIGEMLAMPRGQSGVNTAQQLQMVTFELSIARDRFLAGAPVMGGVLARLWERIEQHWRSLALENRLTTVVDSYRDNYFRDRSLRLIARVTSTFWFLFRWIILSLLVVQFLVIAVTGLILGFAAVLTLSVFITLILFGVWLTRRLLLRDSDEEASEEHGGEESTAQATPASEGRWRRFWRRWWMVVVAVLEVVALAVLLAAWPELREMMLPYVRRFAIGTAVVLGVFFLILLVLFGLSPRLRKREARKRILNWLKREAFPVLGLGFVGLVMFALLIWAWAFLDRVGSENLRFPRFWGDVVEGPLEPGEQGEGEQEANEQE